MKVGIVGNRTGWTYEDVKQKLVKYGINKSDIIISGGAQGVDTYAEDFAKEIGAECVIYHPDPDTPSPQRYYNRNKKIAAQCSKLIAFDNKKHSGTLNTINYARKLGKKIIIVRNVTDGFY